MGAALGHAAGAAVAFQIDHRRKHESAMNPATAPTMQAPPALGAATREQPTAALPRLLAGIPASGAMTLEDHLAVHGEMPLSSARRRRQAREQAAALIDEVHRAGLLGHGGAAFPAATKMRAVASQRRRGIVVINAAEGEPASLKDRTLLEIVPHLVIDGGVLAARAVGADEVILCACESAHAGIEAATEAIEERDERASSQAPKVRLATAPSHYVAGQESALVSHLNGAPARPTFTPPMIFEQGVARRPTLVNNAETLAHLALIARHGASWFRQVGTPAQPGSALVTLAGPVARPGVYEIEHGASLSSLVAAAGGASARLHGVLVGGYSGSWIGAEHLHGLALSNEHLAPHGATFGAGVVVLLSELACPVAETARLARWLAGQSTRQCGPCVHGLDALATSVAQIATGAGADSAGTGQARAVRRVDQLAALVARRGACGHPDGAVKVILSAMDAFQAQFADHARHGPCDACPRPAELPLPDRPVPSGSQRTGLRGR
jgi:NADH:ubiquinone oxidoreductase subunit F (NADH-binding)